MTNGAVEVVTRFSSDSALTGRSRTLTPSSLPELARLVSADRIIEFSELGDFIDEPIRVYSSGMLAKLGFSVISQVEPDILIIDEVLAVGDISFQAKCIQTIRDFKNKGVTILFVSHNMSDVEKICDRVVWIENHKLREIGSAERIIELYKQAMA